MQKPLLDGIRVLDLGRYIAAPYAGQLLADLGAEVVRVERPRPEPDRLRGPYHDGKSLYFVTLNRNKQSAAFEIFSDEGRRLLDELIAKADIIIENFSPRTARNLGFTKDDFSWTIYKSLFNAEGEEAPCIKAIGFCTILCVLQPIMQETGCAMTVDKPLIPSYTNEKYYASYSPE